MSARPVSARSLFRRIRSNSYLRRVFFYLVALLSAIIIASAAASFLFLRAQIMRANGERVAQELKQAAASFTTMFASSIVPAAEQVYETRTVDRLIYGSVLSQSDLLDAVQLLDRFKLANPLIESIEVYNHQLGLIYSTRSGASTTKDPQFEDLMAIFADIQRYGLFRIIPRHVHDTNVMTVIVGSPPFSGRQLLGGLVVNMSERAMRSQLLGRLEGEQTEISILDNNGIVLSGPQSKQFGSSGTDDPILSQVIESSVQSSVQNAGTFTAQRDGGPAYVSWVRDTIGGWTFVSITPTSYLVSVIVSWRNQIIAIFGIVLIISLVLALTTTRSVSLPIERLLSQTKVLQTEFADLSSADTGGDEFGKAAETLQLLEGRLRTLERTIARGGEYEGRRALSRLLRSQSLTNEELRRIEERLSVANAGAIVVAAVALDRLEGLGEEGGHIVVDRAMRSLDRAIAESAPLALHAEVQRGSVGIVLAFPRTLNRPVAEAERILREVTKSASDGATAGTSFTVGLSDPVRSVNDVSAAFDAAAEAVHYRFRYGAGAVIRAADIGEDGLAYVLPEDELRRFTEHARLLDRVLVVSLVESLLAEVQTYAYEDFLFLSQNILYALERVFIEAGSLPRRLVAEFRGRILNSRWIETPLDVSKCVAAWYERFCSYATDGYAQKMATMIADLKQFIASNVSDPELSTKTIAARMKLSVNYVRSVFKAATGESVSAYITRLRIDRCKELLSTTSMNIKEVYVAAGFSNYNYFFTLFKKQTGHTPQDYQRQIARN